MVLFLLNCLGSLQNLSYLDKELNFFVGSIPSTVELPLVKRLVFANNWLAGTVPFSLGQSANTSLQVLNLSSNAFNGSLFHVFANATSITEFDVSSNQFTGWLPCLGSVLRLKDYDCSNNLFTSSISSVFGDAVILYSLVVSNNLLNGTIPSSIGRLVLLNLLNMSSNKLSGLLSSLFSNANASNAQIGWSRLEVLDVSRNDLTGTLPSALFQIPKALRDVLLYFNCFSGSIPKAMCGAGNLSCLCWTERAVRLLVM